MHEVKTYICTKNNEVVFATGFLNEAALLFKNLTNLSLFPNENGYVFSSHDGYFLTTVDVNSPNEPFSDDLQKIIKRIDYLRRLRKPSPDDQKELSLLRSKKRRLKSFYILYSDLLLDLEDK